MPDNNNRIIKQDLKDALAVAELNIARFKPPAAGADPPPETPDPNFRVSIPNVQQQVAEKSAQERTDALFEVVTNYIIQLVREEISRQQVDEKIEALNRRITSLESGR